MTLNDEQVNVAFAKFKDLADKKKEVSDEDIRALIEEKLMDDTGDFALETMLCCLTAINPYQQQQ